MLRCGPVICAIDSDDLAPQLIRAARSLAPHTGGDVRVVHVVRPVGGDSRSNDPTRSRRLLLPPQPRRSGVAQEEELAHRLADAEAMLVRLGVAAEDRLVLQGDAVLEIQTIATRLEAAMLVVGTRGRGSVKAAVLGSVSRDLLRSAPCPVMVVPRGAEEPLRGAAVVCGVDDDGRGEEAVSVAARLAATIGDRLVLAHVTQRKDAAAARQAAAASPVEELPASAALDPARLLRDARQHVREGVDVTVALREGVAAEQLAVLARDVDAAAIVVASRGAGPLSTMVGGSVAQELTTRSHCPVVVAPAAVPG